MSTSRTAGTWALAASTLVAIAHCTPAEHGGAASAPASAVNVIESANGDAGSAKLAAPGATDAAAPSDAGINLQGLARLDGLPGRPWADTATDLIVTDPARRYVSLYDNALAALVYTSRGKRREASRILAAIAKLQTPDGAAPFSFVLDGGPHDPYVRSGALAWAGYAAVRFLDAERDGDSREEITRFAYDAARYLMAHLITKKGDKREGLVRGGFGVHRYEVSGDDLLETFYPEPVEWASVEHNLDTYFFLRALGRMTERPEHKQAADRIAKTLAGLWLADQGQLPRGVTDESIDRTLALDCASWGALFWNAARDRAKTETSFAVADARYRTAAKNSPARGHKPYAHAVIYESVKVIDYMKRKLGTNEWDGLDVVWPEGSAGVALAALRAGDRARAKEILDALEPLRDETQALPTSSREVPFELDTHASVAGTLWVALVRDELANGRMFLFAP